MTNDEQKKLDDFIRETYRKKGAEFKDEMCAADANLEDILPGKTVSCGAVAKARKALGIKLPKGRSSARKIQQALKPMDKRSKQPCSEPVRTTGDLCSFRAKLSEKKEQIEKAIQAVDDAILVSEGVL